MNRLTLPLARRAALALAGVAIAAVLAPAAAQDALALPGQKRKLGNQLSGLRTTLKVEHHSLSR
jgi:hypothetical protein